MRIGKIVVAATAAAGLMSSTMAFAGTATRASTALPTTATALQAPVSGVRHASHTKKTSQLATGGIVIAVLAAGAVVGGIVAAASDNNNGASSPG